MGKNEQDQQSLRVDKWLWFTRFYKTRALAGKAVAAGHVKLNGTRAKASSNVTPGDIIDLTRDQLPFRLEARALPVRRGPASEARQSYMEDDESIERRQQILRAIRTDRLQMPRTEGRPDKQTRRLLRNRNRQPD